MKLRHAVLHDPILTDAGHRLSGTLQAPIYELALISNLRCVTVKRKEWKVPAYVPVERFDSFSPDPDAMTGRKL